MAKPLKRFDLKVRGQQWKVFVYAPDEYKKLEEAEGTHALIDTDIREIYFQTAWVDLPTVRHEVVHLFLKECHVESADLKADQLEEVVCDFLAYNVEEFVEVSSGLHARIHNWLKRAKPKSGSV